MQSAGVGACTFYLQSIKDFQLESGAAAGLIVEDS